MRIDASDRNLVTGGDRFPLDGLPLPPVPFAETGLDAFVLVHDDRVELDRLAPAGMAPLFGLDEVELPAGAGATARFTGVGGMNPLDGLDWGRDPGALAPGRAPLVGVDEVVFGGAAPLPAAVRGRDGVDLPRSGIRLLRL